MALKTSHMEAWQAVLDAHASLTGSLEEALREAELPPLSWFHLLAALDRFPEKRLQMNELAALLNLSRGGLTKLVDRLEAAGLIARVACPTDRRVFNCVLQETGAEMLRRMRPVYEAELERHLAAALDDQEAEVVRDVLVRATRSACSLDGPSFASGAAVEATAGSSSG